MHYLIPEEDEDPYIKEWKENPVTLDIENLPVNMTFEEFAEFADIAEDKDCSFYKFKNHPGVFAKIE